MMADPAKLMVDRRRVPARVDAWRTLGCISIASRDDNSSQTAGLHSLGHSLISSRVCICAHSRGRLKAMPFPCLNGCGSRRPSAHAQASCCPRRGARGEGICTVHGKRAREGLTRRVRRLKAHMARLACNELMVQGVKAIWCSAQVARADFGCCKSLPVE